MIAYWCAVPNAGSRPSSRTTGDGVGQTVLGNAHGFLFQLKTEGYMEIKLVACNSGGVDLKADGAIADVRIEQQADARKLPYKRSQRVHRRGRPW